MPKYKSLRELAEGNGFTREEIEEIELQVQIEVMSLKELREDFNKNQTEVATKMGVKQPQLSRFEQSRNPTIEKLERYIKALGGELELSANFGGKKVRLRLG